MFPTPGSGYPGPGLTSQVTRPSGGPGAGGTPSPIPSGNAAAGRAIGCFTGWSHEKNTRRYNDSLFAAGVGSPRAGDGHRALAGSEGNAERRGAAASIRPARTRDEKPGRISVRARSRPAAPGPVTLSSELPAEISALDPRFLNGVEAPE
jgi:hypothetical protein